MVPTKLKRGDVVAYCNERGKPPKQLIFPDRESYYKWKDTEAKGIIVTRVYDIM